jgi:MoaA/NifB/PqqE/SkfB family radical SAM enzyme
MAVEHTLRFAEECTVVQLIPQAPLTHLQALWFQLTGTLCNLECGHCFIASSPANHRLKFLAPDTVYRYLEEAVQHGVREIYFTGGEPFLHKEILPILSRALQIAATTVLTNGTLITPPVADTLAALAAASRYTLEVRISLDDVDEARNDVVRGKGAWRRALRAMLLLQERGILPIVAVTEYFYTGAKTASVPEQGNGFYHTFRDFLLAQGIQRPRLKIIPVFALGKLDGTMPEPSYVTPDMLQGFDCNTLQCSKSRIVADGGVYACPLLVGEPQALLSSDSLTAALQSCTLYHTACHTCYVTGMTCANY